MKKLIGLAHHQLEETYMGKQEVGEAALRRDRRKLGLVGWIHLQLKVRLTDSLMILNLEAKADAEDEGGDR